MLLEQKTRLLVSGYMDVPGPTFVVTQLSLQLFIGFISESFISHPNRFSFYRLGSKNWISFNVLRGKYCNNLPSNWALSGCRLNIFCLMCYTSLNNYILSVRFYRVTHNAEFAVHSKCDAPQAA